VAKCVLVGQKNSNKICRCGWGEGEWVGGGGGG